MEELNDNKKMTEYDKIRERLRWFINSKAKVTINTFAAKSDVDPSGFAASLKGKRTLSDKTIGKVCSAWSINEEWLRNGEGEPEIKPEPPKNRLDADALISLIMSESHQKLIKEIAMLTEQNKEMSQRIAGLEKSHALLMAILGETEIKNKKQAL